MRGADVTQEGLFIVRKTSDYVPHRPGLERMHVGDHGRKGDDCSVILFTEALARAPNRLCHGNVAPAQRRFVRIPPRPENCCNTKSDGTE
jgi:hypothetical protein